MACELSERKPIIDDLFLEKPQVFFCLENAFKKVFELQVVVELVQLVAFN